MAVGALFVCIVLVALQRALAVAVALVVLLGRKALEPRLSWSVDGRRHRRRFGRTRRRWRIVCFGIALSIRCTPFRQRHGLNKVVGCTLCIALVRLVVVVVAGLVVILKRVIVKHGALDIAFAMEELVHFRQERAQPIHGLVLCIGAWLCQRVELFGHFGEPRLAVFCGAVGTHFELSLIHI